MEKEKNKKKEEKTIIKEKLKVKINNEIINKNEEDEEKKRLEFNSKLLPKIRKDERRAEKLYKVIHGVQYKKKVEEKIEKFKEKIPNIKTKYELNMEKNDVIDINNEQKVNDIIEENEPPIKDWWGDIFKK